MRRVVSRIDAMRFLANAKLRIQDINAEELQENGFEGENIYELVLDWVRYQYSSSPNQMLAELYEFCSNEQVIVEGEAEHLHSCKCCGFKTIAEPSQYDICRWCGWEDDGFTDPTIKSSVNKGSMIEYRTVLKNQKRDEFFHRWFK